MDSFLYIFIALNPACMASITKTVVRMQTNNKGGKNILIMTPIIDPIRTVGSIIVAKL